MRPNLVPALAASLAVASLAAPAQGAVEPAVYATAFAVPEPSDPSYARGTCVAVAVGAVAATVFTSCGTRDTWEYQTLRSGPVAVATFSGYRGSRICWSGYVVPVLDPTPVPFEGCAVAG